uniref:Uncharacterized protein n=1 Tax=Anopheles christyi TaxID=43041 RepID=A0A182KIT1_9DIPT
MFSMLSSVASEAPTLSPGFRMGTSLMISIVPLVNTKPTLPLMWLSSFSRPWLFSR